MVFQETAPMVEAVKRIPCELTVLTYDANGGGSAWLGCNECSRCLLLKYLESGSEFVLKMLLAKPINGGYELRRDLRRSSETRKGSE